MQKSDHTNNSIHVRVYFCSYELFIVCILKDSNNISLHKSSIKFLKCMMGTKVQNPLYYEFKKLFQYVELCKQYVGFITKTHL